MFKHEWGKKQTRLQNFLCLHILHKYLCDVFLNCIILHVCITQLKRFTLNPANWDNVTTLMSSCIDQKWQRIVSNPQINRGLIQRCHTCESCGQKQLYYLKVTEIKVEVNIFGFLSSFVDYLCNTFVELIFCILYD